MSHPVELIDRIAALVQRDYPTSEYAYITEKAIPGTRMHPDILVQDAKGQAVCAVEIGYTRPEKLTAYRRELKIPDVRWYDKQGNLHADVVEKVVKVAVDAYPQTQFVGYALRERMPCYTDNCLITSYGECGVFPDGPDDDQDEEDYNLDDIELTDAQYSDTLEYLLMATCLTVITDYSRVWFHFFCDKCGESEWIAKDADCTAECVAYDLIERDGREFARDWTPRAFVGNWDKAQEFCRDYTGDELVYTDGEFLTKRESMAWQQSLNQIRLEAIRA